MAARRRADGYKAGQLSFDAVWGEPEHARDEQVRNAGDAPLAADRPGPLPADPGPGDVLRRLGEQVESEIQALADALAGPDRLGETYMEKVGRLNMARFNAESDILREMVLIPDPDDPEIDERPATDPLTEASGAIQRLMDEENFPQDEEQETPEIAMIYLVAGKLSPRARTRVTPHETWRSPLLTRRYTR